MRKIIETSLLIIIIFSALTVGFTSNQLLNQNNFKNRTNYQTVLIQPIDCLSGLWNLNVSGNVWGYIHFVQTWKINSTNALTINDITYSNFNVTFTNNTAYRFSNNTAYFDFIALTQRNFMITFINNSLNFNTTQYGVINTIHEVRFDFACNLLKQM